MPVGIRNTVLLALTTLLIVLSGCAGNPAVELRTHFVGFDEQQKRDYDNAKPKEYRVQQGDVLSVVSSYDKDLNRDGVIVLSDGAISLPEIDRVVVNGYTISEVDSMITSEYGKTYRNPSLSVIIEESVGRQVYVMGEVKSPGLHPVPYGGISILNAISIAGGFTDDAQKTHAVLVRLNDQGYLCQEIDLSQFHTIQGIAYSGISLDSYDVIYIPRSKIGDFNYFADTVLSGVLDITRIVTDIRFINQGYYTR